MTDREMIRFGYTPFPDEVYLLHGLLHDEIDREDYDFQFTTADIESLSDSCENGNLDVSCISARAYANLQHNFDIATTGARFGNKRGPVIATREELTAEQIRNGTIAVPDKLDTATLLLQLFAGPDVDFRVVPDSRITKQVEQGNFDGGIIIDKTYLTIEQTSLTASLDLGEWWHEQTGLPVPLGICILNRDLSNPRSITRILHRSVQLTFSDPDNAFEEAKKADPGRDPKRLRTFLDQYVNERSLQMNSSGRRAIQTLFDQAYSKGIIDHPVNPVFIDMN